MMKAIYHIRHKGKIAFLLLILIVIEIHKNTLYQSDISKMGDSFSEVYADRLLAQDYIFKFTNAIYQRRALMTELPQGQIHAINRQNVTLKALISKYEDTRLTDTESITFNSVKQKLAVMQLLEHEFFATHNDGLKQHMLLVYKDKTADILNELQILSGIQIAEGSRLNEKSKSIVLNSAILSEFAWALIIIMGLSMMVVVFAGRSLIPKIRQNEHLN